MPVPITGTLARTVTTYPWPGYDTSHVPSTGDILFDASGDIAYIAFYVSGTPKAIGIGKYVYSTNTLSLLCELVTGTPFENPPTICWNAARSKIMVLRNSNPTTCYEVDLSGSYTYLGAIAVNAPWPLKYAPGWGYVTKNRAVRVFSVLDFGAMTATNMPQTFPYFCQPFELDDACPYTVSASDTPGFGPIFQMDRTKGNLVQFLAGGGNNLVAADQAATNPPYAVCKLKVAEMVRQGSSLYFSSQIAGTWYLAHMDLTTKVLTRLVPSIPIDATRGNFGANDAGTMVIIGCGSAGLKIYV